MTILGVLLSLSFALLSALHFYWAFGGLRGFDQALPKDEKGKRVLNPAKTDCILVGIFLAAAAFFSAVKTGLLSFALPSLLMNYGMYALAFIFMVRALGDFKYIGFSKKITGSEFARLDTNIYSPFCLALGTACLFVQFFTACAIF